MHISFNPGSIVDLNGKPLAGRVTLYQHDSDTLLDVYTLEGDDYVQAQNPLLLDDDGRMQTLFFEVGIADIKVERYVGEEGQMDVSSPDFEDFDFFEYGIDVDLSNIGADTVTSVSDLKDLDPSLSSNVVNLVPTDGSPARLYVWDSSSTDSVDGGYVIGSNVSDTGRWILLWFDEQLPSSIYGVVGGTYNNINALLNYPASVGSFGLRTAPIVRMERGTYDSPVSYYTTKTIAFDADSKWTNATFQCPGIILNGERSDYIADFIFSNDNFEAHSSWFRTVNAFWRCASKKLVIDSSNHFISNQLQYNTTISGGTIIGANRIPTTYNSTSLTLDGCAIVGTIFDSNDFLKFIGMEFSTSWFSSGTTFDFGRIANGNHIQCTFAENNTIMLDNFSGVGTYLKCIEADGTRTEVDLQGRRLNSYSNYFFAKIRNASFGTLSTSVSLSLSRVDCDKLNIYAPASNLSMEFCHVSFGNAQSTLTNISIDSSIVSFQAVGQMIVWDWSPSIDARNSVLGSMYIDWPTNNTDSGNNMSFNDCRIENGSITSKNLFFKNCNIEGMSITIRPYYEDSNYKFRSTFINCRIYNANPITFDMIRDISNPDYGCHDILFDAKIIGNAFQYPNEGIKMPYWAWRSNTSRLIATSGNGFTYDGNYGSCPRNRANIDVSSSNFDEVQVGGDTEYHYNSSFRVCPDVNSTSLSGRYLKCGGGYCIAQVGNSVVSNYNFYQVDSSYTGADEEDSDFFKTTLILYSSPSGTVRVV